MMALRMALRMSQQKMVGFLLSEILQKMECILQKMKIPIKQLEDECLKSLLCAILLVNLKGGQYFTIFFKIFIILMQ